MSICEYCGKSHSGTYASGRFCNSKCARGFSTKAKRKEINRKVSEQFKGDYTRTAHLQTPEVRKKQQTTLKNTLKEKTNNQPVKAYNGDVLDITKGELLDYRKTHLICEICGKSETTITGTVRNAPNNLCVDHSHSTHKFRGLLCQNCNSRLGWYENHKKEIDEYLKRGC